MADRRLVVTERGTRAQRELESDNDGNLYVTGTDLAKESKQDDMITAIDGISGGLTDAELRATPVPTTINNKLVPELHDEIQATYPTASSEVYTYKLDGDTVAVVTVTYTDDTKAVLTSVVRA